jgi:hypothetical protein
LLIQLSGSPEDNSPSSIAQGTRRALPGHASLTGLLFQSTVFSPLKGQHLPTSLCWDLSQVVRLPDRRGDRVFLAAGARKGGCEPRLLGICSASILSHLCISPSCHPAGQASEVRSLAFVPVSAEHLNISRS